MYISLHFILTWLLQQFEESVFFKEQGIKIFQQIFITIIKSKKWYTFALMKLYAEIN